MSSVFKAMISAFRDLFRLRVAWIIVWPLLTAMFFWLGVGYFFWDDLSSLMYQAFDAIGVGDRLKNIQSPWLASSIQFFAFLGHRAADYCHNVDYYFNFRNAGINKISCRSKLPRAQTRKWGRNCWKCDQYDAFHWLFHRHLDRDFAPLGHWHRYYRTFCCCSIYESAVISL